MAKLDLDISEEARFQAKASIINTAGVELTIALDLIEKLGKTLSMGNPTTGDREFLQTVELTIPWTITMIERALLRLRNYPS